MLLLTVCLVTQEGAADSSTGIRLKKIFAYEAAFTTA